MEDARNEIWKSSLSGLCKYPTSTHRRNNSTREFSLTPTPGLVVFRHQKIWGEFVISKNIFFLYFVISLQIVTMIVYVYTYLWHAGERYLFINLLVLLVGVGRGKQ